MKKFLALITIISLELSLYGMDALLTPSATSTEEQALPRTEEQALPPIPAGVQEILLKHHFASCKGYEAKINAAAMLVKQQNSKAWASLVLKSLCEQFGVENTSMMADNLPLILSASLSRSFSMFLVMQQQITNLSTPDSLPALKNALFAAASYGSKQAIKSLAEVCAGSKEHDDVQAFLESLHDEQGKTLLMHAAEHGNVPVLIFLSGQKEVAAAAKQNCPGLKENLGTGEEKIMTYIDLPDKTGKTALIIAIEKDQTKAAEALLNAGADASAMGEESPWDPLHASIHRINPHIVRLLLERKADPTTIYSDYSALEAALIPDAILKDRLSQRGMSPDNDSWYDQLANLRAQSIETLTLLLKHPATQVNIPNSSGDYPLHIALRYPELKDSVAPMLLEAGADITLPDRFGFSGEELLQ